MFSLFSMYSNRQKFLSFSLDRFAFKKKKLPKDSLVRTDLPAKNVSSVSCRNKVVVRLDLDIQKATKALTYDEVANPRVLPINLLPWK